DDSFLIAERHAAADSRIKLIRHEKNMGLGGARNTAIRVAKAEYIASVDSDDFILPEMMNTLWNATDNGHFDVVCCGFNRVDKEGNIISYETYSADTIINENNSINIFSALYRGVYPFLTAVFN
ncbi:TPA: glycosyltransferase family 2 protein, partial [Candidatus Peregrinibacteria bacterium]|nr:glycosyltransferase family 2 protein [Candidatus Peregrinibacteria bacterium]